MEADRELFSKVGLEGALKQVEANPALGTALKQVLDAAGITECDKATGNLLFAVAGSLPDARSHRRDVLAKMIASGALATSAQVAAALDFFKKKTPDADYTQADLDKACGAGIKFSEEQIAAKVADILAKSRDTIVSQRYLFAPATLMGQLREGDWKWADMGRAKTLLDEGFLALVGPRTPDDDVREVEAKEAKKTAGKAKPAPAASPKAPAAGADSGSNSSTAAAGAASGGAGATTQTAGVLDEKFVARELAAAVNTPELIAAHVAATGGRIRARFPPEPNGFLHIGHAKSMNLNFEGVFRALGLEPSTQGATIFRYDDTNPDAEAEEYIVSQVRCTPGC